ncbi:MAG: hypothetical protein ABI311_12025 [Gemmatimonadaceae bacterium]
MERGNDFLKTQIRAATAQHLAFFKALEDHESEADDARYRDLCTRYIPTMRDHQRMLEDYQSELQATYAGILTRTVAITADATRNFADAARESDYARLLNDLAMSRQAESNFRIFRDGGRAIGLRHLAQIGQTGEREHDAYRRDANRLAQQMFVERARTADGRGATKKSETDARP